MNHSDQIESFWQSFEAIADEACDRAVSGDVRTAFDAINAVLSRANLDSLCFGLTAEGDHAVLEFTPEGDHGIATLIDAMMERKPDLPRWVMFPRMQKKPLPEPFDFLRCMSGIDASDASFEVYDLPTGFGVRMYSVSVRELSEKARKAIIWSLLDRMMGEAIVMKLIREVDAEVAQTSGTEVLSSQELVDRFRCDPIAPPKCSNLP